MIKTKISYGLFMKVKSMKELAMVLRESSMVKLARVSQVITKKASNKERAFSSMRMVASKLRPFGKVMSTFRGMFRLKVLRITHFHHYRRRT